MRAGPVLWIAAASLAIYWLTRKSIVKEVEAQAAASGETPAPFITKGSYLNPETYRWIPGVGYVLDKQASATETEARTKGQEKAFEILPIG